jgi:hypothetical protein
LSLTLPKMNDKINKVKSTHKEAKRGWEQDTVSKVDLTFDF